MCMLLLIGLDVASAMMEVPGTRVPGTVCLCLMGLEDMACVFRTPEHDMTYKYEYNTYSEYQVLEYTGVRLYISLLVILQCISSA